MPAVGADIARFDEFTALLTRDRRFRLVGCGLAGPIHVKLSALVLGSGSLFGLRVLSARRCRICGAWRATAFGIGWFGASKMGHLVGGSENVAKSLPNQIRVFVSSSDFGCSLTDLAGKFTHVVLTLFHRISAVFQWVQQY